MRTKVFAIFLMLTVFLFSGINHSCKKTDDSPKNEEESVVFKNPYNKFGVLHNELLKEFYQEVGSEKLTRKEVVAKGVKLLQKKGCLEVNGKQYEIDENFILEIVSCLDADLDVFFGALNEKGFLNDAVTQELRGFAEDVQTNVSYDYQLDRLNQFEMSVLNSASIDVVDKEILLGYCAIDRNSLEFWSNFNSSEKRKFPIWVVAAADAAGFAIGMAGGNPVLSYYISFLVSTAADHKE